MNINGEMVSVSQVKLRNQEELEYKSGSKIYNTSKQNTKSKNKETKYEETEQTHKMSTKGKDPTRETGNTKAFTVNTRARKVTRNTWRNNQEPSMIVQRDKKLEQKIGNQGEKRLLKLKSRQKLKNRN